jgi:hypothetical protein
MKNLKTLSLLLFLSSSFLIACKKEKPGAATEEQPASVSYGNGVVENFQRQPNGSVVVFSNWVTKTHTDWTGFGTGEIKTEINAPSLTDAVRNQGLVLVYFEYADHVYMLPFVRLEYGQTIDYSFITGKITIDLEIMGGGAITDVTDLKFRYVLIPNSTFGGSTNGRGSKPIDYKDYNAVCDYYGIPI